MRRLPNTPEERVKLITALYRQTKDDMSHWRDTSTENYRLYCCWVDEEAYPLRFTAFIPIIYSVIETLLPRHVHGLLFRDPMIQVVKGHPQDEDQAINSAERSVNKWMNYAETWNNLFQSLMQAYIVGTTAGKISYKKRSKKVPIRKPIEVQGVRTGSYVETEQIINYINQPVYENKDMFDVFPDLNHPESPDDMQFVMHAMIKDIDDLEFGDIEYKNLAQVKEQPSWSPSAYDSDLDHRIRVNDRDPQMFLGSPTTSEIFYQEGERFIIEYTWREWDEKGVQCIYKGAISNFELEIRYEKIPVWDWIIYSHSPLPGELLGRGVIPPLKSLQYAINDTVNMQLENMLQALQKLWLLSEDAEVDKDQLVTENLNIIEVAGDINQVKLLDAGDISPAGSQMNGTLMQATQLGSGISDFFRGANPERREVATTVLALQQAAEARIDTDIKKEEKNWLIPIAKGMIETAQSYMTEVSYIPNEQDPNVLDEIDMFAIQGVFDFKMHAAAIGMKELLRSAITDFINNIGQLVGQQAPLSFRLMMATELARTYDGLEDFVNALIKLTQQAQLAESNPQNSGGQGQPSQSNSAQGMASPSGAPPQSQGQAPQGPNGTQGLVPPNLLAKSMANSQ